MLAQSVTFDAERTIIWYLEQAETEGAKSRAALFPTPGVAVFGTTPHTPVAER